MDLDRKKLIQLRAKLELYKRIDRKLDRKLDRALSGDLELSDWSEEVYFEISDIENKLEGLKMSMNLTDDEWDEDENN